MLVSLGHSCQTRFILEALDGASRRMPFDFNITTRAALLAALATDGASLRHDADTASIFRMASDGREGVAVGGLYLWHDYPLADDRLSLADGWQREIGRVNEKYAALWSRFAALLRSDGAKTLVLSNSQHNLGQFSDGSDDFSRNFGLGRQAFEEVSSALDAFGARNYQLLFLTRSVADLAETTSLDDPRLDHRFVGVLSLRPDRRVAGSLQAGTDANAILAVCGTYEDGLWQVDAMSAATAIIHRRGERGLEPYGSITVAEGTLIGWFEGRDRFQEVRLEPSGLRFTDGTVWRRD